MNEIIIGAVTDGRHKFQAVKNALPEYTVVHVPSQIREREITHDIHHNQQRAAVISREKALYDIDATSVESFTWQAWWLIHGYGESTEIAGKQQYALYSDVIQYLPEDNIVLERPNSKDTWFLMAWAHRNKKVWIYSGHTALDLTDGQTMHTVSVVTELQGRNFSKEELLSLKNSVGLETLMNAAGGLPVRLAQQFYDQTIPAEVYFYPDAQMRERVHLATIPWNNISADNLISFATGVFREPMTYLFDRMQSQKPA